MMPAPTRLPRPARDQPRGQPPHRPRRAAAALLVAPIVLMLAGCGGDGDRPASAGTRPAGAPVAVLRPTPPLPVQIQQIPGVEGVIGADAAGLIRLFGTPRLDVREGDARKLQFAGVPCVLDIYLYPLSPGHAPVASYVDARRGGDGRAVDRAACIALLRRR